MDVIEDTESVLSLETLNAINFQLEALYDSKKTINIGQKMADIKSNTQRFNTQIRNLENLVMSTKRFSEIINFIKNQTGKDKNGQWPLIADTLLHQLEELEDKAKEIGKDNPNITFEVKKHLARGWVKQIVAHYFFADSKRKEE
jgi:archaellum component FlaC